MIKSIQLKFGSAPSQPPVIIEQPMITVFVGSNNSGKSQVLREIHQFCESGSNAGSLILENILFESLTGKEYDQHLVEVTSPLQAGDLAGGHYIKINGNRLHVVHEPMYRDCRLQPNKSNSTLMTYTEYYSRHFLTNLDGANRMGLVRPQRQGDLINPQSAFAKILINDQVRSKIRSIVHDAFSMYFGIDISKGGELHLGFGDTPPPRERTVENDMLEWVRNAKGIESVSDGVKAFTGILIQLYVGNSKIITIDEPEAFLHPALSFKLGQEIAKLAIEKHKNVFVATHSSQFLMGVIQSGAKVNIVRLTYEGGIATARTLAEDQLKTMMNDPFLRSANVMSGLFYKYVVVTEADADRAFYQEINERLKESDQNKGCANTLFLNANGKHTVHRILSPLRHLGIPAVAIVDIDALRDDRKNWTNHLNALSIPPDLHESLSILKAKIWRLLEKNTHLEDKYEIKNKIKQSGVALLDGEERETAENLLSQLREYGFFIVPVGEVEQWLAGLDVNRGKRTWLGDIFNKMGNDPSSEKYLKSADDDVWAFINEIGVWFKNTNRKGIPVA